MLVQTIGSEHASEATAPPLAANQAFSWSVFPLPSHSTVKSLATVVISGSIVSSIVKVCIAWVVLLQASVIVNTLVTTLGQVPEMVSI